MGGPSGAVMFYEFKADLNAYLEGLRPDAPVASLEEIIEFNLEHPELELQYFQQEAFLRARSMGPLTDPEYREALAEARRLSRDEGTDRVLEEHGLDAIIAPTGSPAWRTDLISGDNDHMASAGPAAIAGYPNISVPMGFFMGLPVNLSFWAGAWSEPTLLRIASGFEEATRVRRPPTFIPTLDLG